VHTQFLILKLRISLRKPVPSIKENSYITQKVILSRLIPRKPRL